MLTLQRLSISVDHDFDRIWQALQQLQRSTGGSIADHVQEADPHTQYLTDARAGAKYLTTEQGNKRFAAIGGTLSRALSDHRGESDPHPQYAAHSAISTAVQRAQDYTSSSIQSTRNYISSRIQDTRDYISSSVQGVRGYVSGKLAEHKQETDPHPGYLTDAEGDAKYLGLATFESLKAENGYQKMPSGLIMQWGYASASNPSHASIRGGDSLPLGPDHRVTFPIAFPSAVFMVHIVGEYREGITDEIWTASSGSLSGQINKSEVHEHTYTTNKVENTGFNVVTVRLSGNRGSENDKYGASWLAIGY